jgi:hypothetical protein
LPPTAAILVLCRSAITVVNNAHVDAQLELPTILYVITDTQSSAVALLTDGDILEIKWRVLRHFDVIWSANVVEALRSLIGTRVDD